MRILNSIAAALLFALPALANEATVTPAAKAPPGVEADNTEINKRDRDSRTLTPMDQAKGTRRDVELTRKIRRLVMKEKDLSSDARNVKIITLHGKATLRGPVGNLAEKSKLGVLAARVVGPGSVSNELEVKTDEPKTE